MGSVCDAWLAFEFCRLFGVSCADCSFYFSGFFWRWQYCVETETLNPEFSAPPLAMVEVFVFFVLNLVVGCLQGFGGRAFGVIRACTDECPVLVIFGFGENHALARDEFGARGVACRKRKFHCLNQSTADVAHDGAAWTFMFRIQTQYLAYVFQRLGVLLGLFEVLRPLAFEFFVQRAGESCRVHVDPTTLVLERLQN